MNMQACNNNDSDSPHMVGETHRNDSLECSYNAVNFFKILITNTP